MWERLAMGIRCLSWSLYLSASFFLGTLEFAASTSVCVSVSSSWILCLHWTARPYLTLRCKTQGSLRKAAALSCSTQTRGRNNDRVRGGKMAHYPSACDVQWEAQPGALNPLSAGPLLQSQPSAPLHVSGMGETCVVCSMVSLCCVGVSGPVYHTILQLICHLRLGVLLLRAIVLADLCFSPLTLISVIKWHWLHFSWFKWLF